MKPQTKTFEPWNSIAKPRPDSLAFHHQPLSGAPACGACAVPSLPNAKRCSGVTPPGHVSVSALVLTNVSCAKPGDGVVTGARYGPVSVCPPASSTIEAAKRPFWT